MHFRPLPPLSTGLSLLLCVAATCAAFVGAGIPSAAAAGTSNTAPSGLHDGMMPPDSPDHGSSTATRVGVEATSTTLVGPDVSGWQHPSGAPIDWTKVAGSGQSFTVVKATELYTDSTTGKPVLYTNPYLHSDLSGAQAAGLVVGAYAFAHPENSATAQADDFAAAVGPLPAGSLPPVLDLETSGGLSVAQLVSWTQTFLARLTSDTRIVPMIYTGPNFWKTYLGNSTAFTAYPLWEAHYTTASSPAPIGGWNTYSLWQFTDSATIPGISGSADQNRFNGTAVTALSQYSGTSAINARASDPATAAIVGTPTSKVFCGLTNGGCGQHFSKNASIYWSLATGAHYVRNAIRGTWAATGWENKLGYPTTDEFCGLISSGCGQQFSNNASIYWSSATGAHFVRGAIRGTWAATGWENKLGYPTTDEFCGLISSGCGQHFSNYASIYWSPGTGAHYVRNAIRGKWAATGWEHNLGYPTTDEFCGLISSGCGQQFSNNASIYWSPATGPHFVRGAIRGEWAATGWETKLGYPTTDGFCGLTSSGCGQHFSNYASIYWSPATGAHFVRGAIRGKWAATGWEHNLGYPTTDEFCGLTNSGCGQQFSNNASIYWSPATGAHFVRGAIRGTWAATGWETKLGYPTTDGFCGLTSSGCGQHFSNYASIYWSPATGAHEVQGAIRGAWAAAGWEHGRYGYPIGSAYLSGAQWLQRFQGGTIAVSA
jgi:GH25 family lysozyme M1 (1,4-beta-N-acetylmuramidase)/uncharacterized protein with LGFP repeats